jgi:8-oxo-dGTP diphosphatase
MLTRLHRVFLQVFRVTPPGLRRQVVRAVAPKYSVGATCLIERPDGRVLLVRQSYRERWGLPGGLLKRREDPADGVRREVAEEVALAVELVGEPAVVVEARLQRIDVVYRARPAAGIDPDSARACTAEIIEVGWFHPDGLPELQPETASALVVLARAHHPGTRQVRNVVPDGLEPPTPWM